MAKSKSKSNPSRGEPLFRGTVAQLAGKLTVNGGETLSQPEISMLMRAAPSMVEAVDVVRQPGKGRPATVYDWFDGATLTLGVKGATIKNVSAKTFAKIATPTGNGVVNEETITA